MTYRVGTYQVPFFFNTAAASASMYVPCSIERAPALLTQIMPSLPWQCAATKRPRRLASSTAARISSCV